MRQFKVFVLGLLLALSAVVQTTTAQYLPTDARALYGTRVPFPIATAKPKTVPLVEHVGAIGMTVSDMDASIDFYSRVLSFEKLSDVEVTGEDYERLQGVFGLRMRVVRMRLGDELIELTEYLAPKGRPVPVDSRRNDRWFQHIAIITSDMDKAYALLRQTTLVVNAADPEMDLPWGMFGENFTTTGITRSGNNIGDKFRIGTAEVMVTQPRMPVLQARSEVWPPGHHQEIFAKRAHWILSRGLERRRSRRQR